MTRAALALAFLLAALPARAGRPLAWKAPEFPPESAWLNAKPLTLDHVRDRKIVLVAFLNLASANSVRTLPALSAWFDRYWEHGLLVIGVLTPELEMQRNPAWSSEHVKRFGIGFPVVLDADRRIWKSYGNEGWPALYLLDRKGRVVFDRLGEGGYAEFESELREALTAFASEHRLPKRADPPEPPTKDCGPAATRETALGSRPGGARALSLDRDFSRGRTFIIEARQGEVSTKGRWELLTDGLRLAETNRNQSAFVRVVYQGAQALAVLAPPAGRPTRFFVKTDDLWLHEGTAGKDVTIDEDGRSFVTVDRPRLYDVAKDPEGRPHELYLHPVDEGASIHGFSFADACVPVRLP